MNMKYLLESGQVVYETLKDTYLIVIESILEKMNGF